MSDSDSDLNFESADEDAEFASCTKSKSSQNSSKEPSEFSAKGDDSLSALSKNPNTSSEIIEGLSYKQHYPSGEREIVDGSRDKSQDSQVVESDKSQDSQVVESDKCPNRKEVSAEALIDAAKESEAESGRAVDELQSDKSQPDKSKTHRERVILRLEKKQQLLKESPVESEKPSDFVNILQDPNENKQSSTWGFGSWGSSLLSSAASSVSTFSTQVSQGIGSVLETVESTLGAPPPEELAHTLNEKKAETEDAEKEGGSGLSSWTRLLENTGSKVLLGGLDTLELIGKKTMDILTEGDPGLRKKRAAFARDAQLSELLREIKARADEQSREVESAHYSQIFDERQGLAHLEALEMLSKQSQARLQRLLMRHAKHAEVKKRLEEIKSICENTAIWDDPSDCENFEDFETVFKKYTLELSFPLNVDNIINTQQEISETISSYENASEGNQSPPKAIFQSAICSLAEFTARCIETFHKAAELVLVQPNLGTESCATNLTGLTTVMCIEVNNLSSRYHKCLEKTAESAEAKTLATNVYVEASNSNNYIQDAYQMLVPVLQVRFLEAID